MVVIGKLYIHNPQIYYDYIHIFAAIDPTIMISYILYQGKIQRWEDLPSHLHCLPIEDVALQYLHSIYLYSSILWTPIYKVLYLPPVLVGSIYLHRCPANIQFPIWMIVFGVFGLILIAIDVTNFCRIGKKNNGVKGKDCRQLVSICFGFFPVIYALLYIIGNIWVFQCFNGVDLDACCHPVPYYFSFVTLIVMNSINALYLCCFCWIFCIQFNTYRDTERLHALRLQVERTLISKVRHILYKKS